MPPKSVSWGVSKVLLPLLLAGLVASPVNLKKNPPLFGEFKSFKASTDLQQPSTGISLFPAAHEAEWSLQATGTSASASQLTVQAYTRTSPRSRSGMNALLGRMGAELSGLCLGATKAQQGQVRAAILSLLTLLERQESSHGPAIPDRQLERQVGPIRVSFWRQGSYGGSRSLGDSGEVAVPPEWIFDLFLYRDPKKNPWRQACLWR